MPPSNCYHILPSMHVGVMVISAALQVFVPSLKLGSLFTFSFLFYDVSTITAKCVLKTKIISIICLIILRYFVKSKRNEQLHSK